MAETALELVVDRQILHQYTNVVQVLGKKKEALGPGFGKTVLRWLASVSEEDHFIVVGDPGRERWLQKSTRRQQWHRLFGF